MDKIFAKMKSLVGGDGRLTKIAKHPTGDTKLPGWVNDVLEFCSSSKPKKEIAKFKEELNAAYKTTRGGKKNKEEEGSGS